VQSVDNFGANPRPMGKWEGIVFSNNIQGAVSFCQLDISSMLGQNLPNSFPATMHRNKCNSFKGRGGGCKA
jgi:hypothetical protein